MIETSFVDISLCLSFLGLQRTKKEYEKSQCTKNLVSWKIEGCLRRQAISWSSQNQGMYSTQRSSATQIEICFNQEGGLKDR